MSTDTTAFAAPLLTADIIDYSRWEPRLPELGPLYRSAHPFPHIVLENFLKPEALDRVIDEFPSSDKGQWIHYAHFNENKRGLNRMDTFPPHVRAIISELNSPRFCSFLSELTDIPNLLADNSMEGGGLHESRRGGFLNIHADFTAHPHQKKWKRRVNILVYLNKDWKDEYGGHLELWTRDMKQCAQKVAPLFNRCVIFTTDETSYHGHPEPLNCPENMSRRSIALYYFTEEMRNLKVQSTQYRARPGEGLKKLFVWIDTQIVAAYTIAKRSLGINDEWVSRMLRWMSGNKK